MSIQNFRKLISKEGEWLAKKKKKTRSDKESQKKHEAQFGCGQHVYLAKSEGQARQWVLPTWPNGIDRRNCLGLALSLSDRLHLFCRALGPGVHWAPCDVSVALWHYYFPFYSIRNGIFIPSWQGYVLHSIWCRCRKWECLEHAKLARIYSQKTVDRDKTGVVSSKLPFGRSPLTLSAC